MVDIGGYISNSDEELEGMKNDGSKGVRERSNEKVEENESRGKEEE
ncbi:hypothetical protein [Priestia megaterium]|nr:hypothetical protein [Priestia megaterium]